MLQGPKPLPPDDPELTKILAGMASRSFASARLPNVRKDGSPFTNLLAISPFVDTAGHVQRYVGVQCDVDKHLEKHKDAAEDPEWEQKWLDQARGHCTLCAALHAPVCGACRHDWVSKAIV